MSVINYLEDMRTYGGTDTLPYFLKLAGIKTSLRKKDEMVSILNKYLSDEQNIAEIWKRLNPYEKELMEEFVRSGGRLDSSEIEQITKKHGRKGLSYYTRYFPDLFSDGSKARLFFVPYYVPEFIFNILKKLVKPLEIKYTPIEKIDDKGMDKEIIIGENFEKDFINIIKLINKAKLKTTKGNGLPTKSAALKMNEALENPEILTCETNSIVNIKNLEQTCRIYSIFRLLKESDIINKQDGALIVGPKASKFLKCDIVQKCDMLLKAYIRSDVIYELDEIREIRIRTDSYANLENCRELILEYLSDCPIGKWISMREFLVYVKKNNRSFLVKEVGEISSYESYYRYFTGRMQSWEELEGRFIEVMFLEYLSVMGIVDAAVVELVDSFDYYSVEYFRLTPLGAYILGSTDEYDYDTKDEKSGFIIQPNYEVIVGEGSLKHNHILFFDKFAEKVSEDAVNIYKLTFKAAVNALDNGISIRDIIDYLKGNSENSIPENVLLTLEKWDSDSRRIRIRNVTIVETDDKYLMEELKSYKTIKNNILDELPYVFEIDGKSANKVKRDIEKKNRFCAITNSYPHE